MATPTPLNVTANGLSDALRTMNRVADFVPAEVGVNITVTVRLCPAATVAVVGDTLN